MGTAGHGPLDGGRGLCAVGAVVAEAITMKLPVDGLLLGAVGLSGLQSPQALPVVDIKSSRRRMLSRQTS